MARKTPQGRGFEPMTVRSVCATGSLVLFVLLVTDLAGSLDKGGKAMAFELKSAAFSPAGDIPKRFTCDGPDVSPALSWGETPAGTQSISLIMDDPDAPAGTWVHWVLYELPASTRELPENLPKDRELNNGGRQGQNDFGRIGYGGPCPPRGRPHRYFFKLYALDAKTNLGAGATKADLERAMKGHILAQAELMGRHKR
jgi:Raf kinase inhibitor-like YbhB/YbcL family protein